MKKYIILLTLIFITINSYACDICGGGLGNNATGLLPNFNKRFVGIRYHFNQLHTQLDVNGNKTALSNKEKYNTVELWSAWNIGTKWRVMAILPYSYIQKYNYGTAEESSKNGLGDINLSGYYNLMNNSSNTFTHTIWVGLGVKLQTGSYNKDEFTNSNSPNIYQLGTGSTDITMSINYDIRFNNIGLNSNINYKINSKNNDDYRYGDKLSLNSSLYYQVKVNEQTQIRPNIGLVYESQQKDHTMSYKIEETGGYNTNYNFGVESNSGNIALGVTYQAPLKQHISQGRTELTNKLLAHVSYTF